VEQHHDANGICWPTAIAPYEVIVVIANVADDSQRQLGEQLYGELQAAGVEALLDDRAERAGVKFKDADLLGIPWRVVVGRGAADGQVELVQRASAERTDLAAPAVVAQLLEQLQRERVGLLQG
jgi:prolyl-tRNA synthetase